MNTIEHFNIDIYGKDPTQLYWLHLLQTQLETF